ncbi:MAG: hypothetical protein JWM16_2705, partial [Verrucomicrobiales bacterium]|nr:hypothetical protein [Verrucomicrobiales bacterium]
TIGTLPAGKSITITFRATVANPVPSGVCVVSNQGTVSASGPISIVTDDPRTVATQDATSTALLVPPIVATQPASAITGTSAVLNGLVNPCGTNTSYYFQYGLTTAYGSNTPLASLPAGLASVPVSASLASLAPGVLYHFRLLATNSVGTNAGIDRTFTTPLDIIQQPANAGSCVGGTASFSVAATSTNVTYQWQKRASGAVVFQNISGATAASYTTPPATAADDGSGFRVIVAAPSTSVTSAEALLSVITINAPAVTYNFNNGLPPDTAIYGNAFLSNGVLELNTNAPSQTGAFLTADLAPGRLVRGFTATFKMRVQPGSSPPADGFSFNWATDLPNGPYAAAEEGEGSGLRVCFDTYDNGLVEAPAIDVKWGTNVIAHYAADLGFLPGSAGDFADVAIRLNTNGTLDVSYRCRAIFSRLPVPGYLPLMSARFGIGSRTGGLYETHGLDDLALQLAVDPTNGVPRITSVSNSPPSTVVIRGTGTPGANVALLASTNFTLWKWRANVTPDIAGAFQFTENTSLAPYRFYRLGAASQLPSGLVTWWRAESNYLDSFGPNNGSLTGPPPSFVTGQRGQAFSFNGTNQILIGGTAIPVPWTAAFWVKRQDAFGASAAVLTSPSSALKLEQIGTPRFVGFTAYGVGDYSFNYSVPTNTWTHLTFVAAPGSTVLYTNGVAAATNTATISLPLNLVNGRENATDLMRGLLDEVTLFNRALAPAEITNVINVTRGP